MKYKALVLSFLLLAPIALAGIAFADWPVPPQQNPTYQLPILFVDVNGTGVHGTTGHFSSDLKVWGPCIVSSYFNVDVKLWNENATTGYLLYDVYAVDFTLTWSSAAAYIKLTNAQAHLPTGWFLANESKTADSYKLAMTDMYPDHGILNCVNVSLATLTFHIEDEPVAPKSFSTPFTLVCNGMSADGTVPLPIIPEQDSGSYCIGSKQPDICLRATDDYLINYTKRVPSGEMLYMVNESAVGKVHTIKVMLSDITHAFGFYVRVTWDPLYKKTDIQKVRIGQDWILANYAYENIVVGSDYLEITLKRPTPPLKPLICSKLDEAFEFDLTVISPDVGKLPTPKDSFITIDKASILAWDVDYGGPVEYNYNMVGPVTEFKTEYPSLWNYDPSTAPPTAVIEYSCDMVNMWNPKPADITLDGHVNIDDLKTLANWYNQHCVWGNLAYILVPPVGTPNVVDIFDLVFVAKNIGDC